MAASAASAASPVRSDPFIRQGEPLWLGFPCDACEWEFAQGGKSVALSADGNTALVGASNSAWIFTRSGSTWTEQAKLTAGFGDSVALASDGKTALIGGPTDNEGVGAAWVFTRSGSTWSQQGEKLTGTGETGRGQFGTRVALSSQGNTALIGGNEDNSGRGAAWVFTRSRSTWAQAGSKLTGGAEVGQGNFGHSVALAAGGKIALIGGPGDKEGIGATWLFRRSGKTWNQQGEKLTATGEIGNGHFGSSVALSSDGKIALIGGDEDKAAEPNESFSHYGAAWVFTRSGKVWTEPGEKLTSRPFYGGAYCGAFGSSVALASNGNTALIGDPSAPYACFGTASFFTRSDTTWTRQDVSEGPAGEHPPQFGTSVALSSDGNTALIGSPEYAHQYSGAAFVYVNAPPHK